MGSRSDKNALRNKIPDTTSDVRTPKPCNRYFRVFAGIILKVEVSHAILRHFHSWPYINREKFEAMQGFHAGWWKSGIGGADGKHGLYEYTQTHTV